MASAEAALERLCDPQFEVSAHYLIARDGRLWQLVDEDMRAWHAGAGSWQGQGDVNSRSIGIELDNDGASPFSELQMTVLESLLSAVMARHDVPCAGIIAHSDMAPVRKQDPGRRFDWLRLARQGVSIWPQRGDDLPFEDSALKFGFPAEGAFEAFRQRFRPAANGPCDETDRRLMADLAERFGVDGAGKSA